MFNRARLRLTAWYAVTMLAVLLVLGAGTYGGLVWALDREVDAGIRATVEDWRASAPPLAGLEALDIERHIDDAAADVFLIVFRADGALVANPAGIEVEDFVQRGLVTSALEGRETWTTFSEHGHFRVWAVPVVQDGAVAGAVVGGRSVTGRDESVRNIIAVLGVVAAVGFLLALAASYVLAGRAMTPLRLAHERERSFVGDASHELRSPITLARALAELLQRGSLEPDQRATVDELVAVTDEASALIDDLLALARAEERSDTTGAARADLAIVAAQTIERMAPILSAHGCRIERDLGTAPARVSEMEARRVLRSLLENVVAHTPQGTRVRVRTLVEGRHTSLTVADDGPGVPFDDLERVFERFTQIDVARTPGAQRGAGLGLAIVGAIARRRGGLAIARRSDLGGLEVELEFPSA